MRLLILSDLHLEQWGGIQPEIDLAVSRPDVVVLAGDIHNGAKAIPWAAMTFAGIPVLYVHGNHEAYGHKLEGTIRELEQACQQTDHVRLLHCNEWHLGNIRFLGATLWTDFKLFGDERRDIAMDAVQNDINDYHRIRLENRGFQKMRPTDTARFHSEQRDWIRKKLDEPFEGKTVVITHMAPSMRSVPEEYMADIVSTAYASNLDALVESADLWIHGHMHTSCDYTIGQCRIICNPRGYHLSNGRGENRDFDPNCIVEILT